MPRPAHEPVEHAVGHRLRHLEADDVAEAPPAELELDGLEQVVGLVRDGEVGVARDAKGRRFGDLHLREEPAKEMRDHRIERDEVLSLPEEDEAGKAFGHLHARESLIAGFGVAYEHAEAQGEPRDVGEPLAGTERERGEDGVDIALEALGELCLLGLVALGDAADEDALVVQSRSQLPVPDAGLLRGQLAHPVADLRQRLLRELVRRVSGPRSPPRPGP